MLVYGSCSTDVLPPSQALHKIQGESVTIREGLIMGSAEADKLMKQADKHCNPSFFSMRIKGDWEQATPLYERAAKLYKVSSTFGGLLTVHYWPNSLLFMSCLTCPVGIKCHAHQCLLVQQAKKPDQARYAFERAALGQERQTSPWQAGKLLEQAVTCARDSGDQTNLVELSK